MSTKKPTASNGPDELSLLRARAKALEADLARANAALVNGDTVTARINDALAGTLDKLRVVSSLLDNALTLHAGHDAERSILVAVERAVLETRERLSDALPRTTPMANAGSYAVDADGKVDRSGSYAFRASEKAPA